RTAKNPGKAGTSVGNAKVGKAVQAGGTPAGTGPALSLPAGTMLKPGISAGAAQQELALIEEMLGPQEAQRYLQEVLLAGSPQHPGSGQRGTGQLGTQHPQNTGTSHQTGNTHQQGGSAQQAKAHQQANGRQGTVHEVTVLPTGRNHAREAIRP